MKCMSAVFIYVYTGMCTCLWNLDHSPLCILRRGSLTEVSVLTALDSQPLPCWSDFLLGFCSEPRSLAGLATGALLPEPSPACYFVVYPAFLIGCIEDRHTTCWFIKPSNHRQLIWEETPDLELDSGTGQTPDWPPGPEIIRPNLGRMWQKKNSYQGVWLTMCSVAFRLLCVPKCCPTPLMIVECLFTSVYVKACLQLSKLNI